MWVWRDDLGQPGETERPSGWRLSDTGSWVWDEASPLRRAGAGTGALRSRAVPDPAPVPAREEYRPRADRAIAALSAGDGAVGARPSGAGGALPDVVTPRGGEPTPIFHELTVDRTRRHARVPEPHPGSGPLPVQDPRGHGLAPVPTVPPPAAPEDASSPEEEMRRRAERRRRPRASAATVAPGRESESGGRHSLRREEPVGGRHALRR